jgi:hypothetical protein
MASAPRCKSTIDRGTKPAVGRGGSAGIVRIVIGDFIKRGVERHDDGRDDQRHTCTKNVRGCFSRRLLLHEVPTNARSNGYERRKNEIRPPLFDTDETHRRCGEGTTNDRQTGDAFSRCRHGSFCMSRTFGHDQRSHAERHRGCRHSSSLQPVSPELHAHAACLPDKPENLGFGA